MTKMIQIRNVPEDLHRTFNARAALAGMSLSDYLLDELRRIAKRPTRRELQQRLASREPVRLSMPSSELIRGEREDQ